MRIKALASALILASFGLAAAQTEVVWWDFLSGGDGVRMKALIDEFNETHSDIQIDATTSEWGLPFYTKVQTAAAVGEHPDVMTYHMSRFPLGVEQGVLRPISDEELSAAGLSKDAYQPGLIDTATIDGNLYGIPFDIHSIVLYYNRDILDEAGLIGEDGRPTGLEGIENFNEALQTIADNGHLPLSFSNSADPGTVFRIFYTLMNQQEGAGNLIEGEEVAVGEEAHVALETMVDWVESDYARANVDYPSSIALFTSGEAAFMINGVWEVPTMVDLAASDELGFDWGAIAIPTLFDRPATWADSHAFAIPAANRNEVSDEKVAAVLEVIAWMNENSLDWASAGHIPAYASVTESPEYQEMEPNATYAVLAENTVFDPRSTLAGVASPLYDAVENYLEPSVNGQLPADQALEMFQQELEGQMR